MESDHFATAITIVLGGGSYLPIEILQEGEGAATAASSEKPFESVLTPREKDVLVRLAVGASNKEIARELSLAEVTVKLHVRQILRKIEARNRSEAASMAVRAGLI
jgi:DNA-binding NarL/FixJ family response regulator